MTKPHANKKRKRRKAGMVGRPSKFTPARVKEILCAIAEGLPAKYAAAFVGISQDTLCEWKNQFPEFSERFKRAEARGVRARLRSINRAAKRNAKWAAWWLEHVHPEFFAKSRIEHTHSGEVTVKPEIDLKKLSTEELKDLRALYAKASKPLPPKNGGESP